MKNYLINTAKMTTTAFFVLCMVFYAQAEAAKNKPFNFYEGTYESAKAKAGEEGKLFMVDFYANWCTPCKWMDKTTFKDDQVKKLLSENYVSLKIDIDQPEGYDLKEQFDVTMLPTILIFNSQGKMVERIEKTLTAESLSTILTFHNHSKNKVVQKHVVNTSPKRSISAPQNTSTLSDVYEKYREQTNRKLNYRVQIANYSDYEEAFVRVNELRDQFFEPIIVLNDYVDGATIYKVLLGEFKTIEEAESFRVILKNDFQIDGIIK